VIRGLIIALALVGTGCDHEVAGSGDMGDMATGCGVAPGAPCCTPFTVFRGDLSGIACAPGLACQIPDGGASHHNVGTCEVAP